MSSWVITWIAEAACDSFSGRLETDVTSRFISCSSVSFLSAPGDAAVSGCWARLRGGGGGGERAKPGTEPAGQRSPEPQGRPPEGGPGPAGPRQTERPPQRPNGPTETPHAPGT